MGFVWVTILQLPKSPSVSCKITEQLTGFVSWGQAVSFKSEAEKDLFVEMVEIAERRARSTMTNVKYPIIAGSDGVTIFMEKV